ncbi:response regulator [Loktanella sp. DJP18]|uniref:response regulator n=1 Tax=Loktanella sp. DJP18 TaxID=3409788 RepID=UPI003BB75DFF
MRILAVDDDPFILELLEEIVGGLGGHDLTTVENGHDALSLIDAEPAFDCVMLDIQMPGMSGIEVCHAIRQLHGYDLTPILMLTAMSDKKYIDGAFRAGATDYLNKPFEVTELQARVDVLRALVEARRQAGDTLTRMPSGPRAGVSDAPLSLYKPFDIRDIDGIVDVVALENYVARLSRTRLFGSSVFAISVRRVEQLYLNTSSFDFQSMIVDIAEALSDTLSRENFMAAYAGNGTFVCVIEGGKLSDFDRFTDQLNIAIHALGMHCSDGRPLHVRVCAGQSSRLMWQSGASALDTMSQAVNSAEQEAQRLEKNLENFWYMGASA